MHCDYCGSLDWTIQRWGTLVHKQDCPHREAPYSQTTPPERPDPVTFDLRGCARCDAEGHPGLTFEALFLPIEMEPGVTAYTVTHWAACPVNGQPILLTGAYDR